MAIASAAFFQPNQVDIDIANFFEPNEPLTQNNLQPNNLQSAIASQLASPQLLAKAKEVMAYFSPIKTLSHAGDIFSIDVSSQGLVASASSEGNIALWNLSSGENVTTLAGEHTNTNTDIVRLVTFSPDGQTIATVDDGGNLIVTNLTSQTPVQVSLPDNLHVSSVVFSPDSKSLGISGLEQLLLWKITSNEILPLGATSSNVVAFSPDGQFLASDEFEEYSIQIWNAKTGQLVKTLAGHSDWIRSLAFSADGQFLASISYDGTVRLWQVSTGEQTIENNVIPWDIAFSPNAEILAIGATYGLLFLDLNTGKFIRMSDSPILSVAFSPDGQTLVTGQGNMENNLKFWRVPVFKFQSMSQSWFYLGATKMSEDVVGKFYHATISSNQYWIFAYLYYTLMTANY